MHRITAPIVLALVAVVTSSPAADHEAAPELLLRCDDVGMSHATNLAIGRLLATGLPFSASVMVVGPWYLETAALLRDRPQVSVGLHLALNSEWEHLKWGPIAGAARVPSLVDENGHLHATSAAFAAAEVDLADVEVELRAQIDRARLAGLELDYLDYHMLTAVSTPELRAIVEKLAREHGLGLSTYFGERSVSLWDVPPEAKLNTLLDVVGELEPGAPNLVVMHLGLETPEMNALVDVNNPADPYRVARHRQAELDALTSPAFRDAVEKRGVRLTHYGELVEREGLDAMVRPAGGPGYSMEE